VTVRAFLIGLFLSIFAALWPAWSSYIIASSRADYGHLSAAILIPFLVLLLLNASLSRKGRGLTGSELILIVSMGMVASLAQGEWIAGYFLGVITAVSYFASAENGWEETLLTRIPEWSIVGDRDVTSAFYQGLPAGAPFPWEAWLTPLLWWGGFFLAFFIANLCIVVVFRRQWMDNERLPFPIAAGLLELTGEGDVRGTLTTLMRDRLFQIGAISVFLIFIWDPISWFSELMPAFEPQIDRVIPIARGFPFIRFSPNAMTIAFAYFTKSEVLLSLWVFHLITILQVGIMTRFGLEMGASDPYGSYHPAVGWQSFGSLIVFVFWGLWVGRSHLTAVVRKAFVGDDSVDDSEELMSYRTAVFLFLACGLFSGVFLWRLGLTAGPLVAFWGATLVLYIGFARIIVETGLVFLRTPLTGQAFAWHLFGSSGIGPVSATALGLSFAFIGDAKTLGITTLAHIPRLGLAVDRARRKLLPVAVCVGFVAGTVAVISFIIYQGNYGVGSYNFGSVSFNGSGDGAVGLWGGTATRIRTNDLVVGWSRLLFLAIGAVLTVGLYAFRYRFPRLAPHPIGFAISGSDVLRSGISSVFLVWLVKDLIFRFGGLDHYRRMTPLFMGILIGYLAAVAVGIIVDAIWFPGQGHKMHGW
jgi:hypothetical protein